MDNCALFRPFGLKHLLRLISLVVVLASIVDVCHNHALRFDQPDNCVLCHQADHLSSAATPTAIQWPLQNGSAPAIAGIVSILTLSFITLFYSRAPPAITRV